MFPVGDDDSQRRTTPYITYALVGLNVLLFLIELSGGDQFIQKWSFIPARFSGNPEANAVTIFTAMFMHGGWMHLIFNMWFLWIFGPAMEARFGRVGFAALYLLGGIAANLVHLATHAGSTDPVLGASGAIAAIIGAYAVTYPSARVLTIVPIGFIPLFFRIPAVVFALLWFGLQVLQGTLELATPSMAGTSTPSVRQRALVRTRRCPGASVRRLSSRSATPQVSSREA